MTEEKISQEFKDFTKKYAEDSAEEHIRVWKDRYYCKTKSQIEEDLYINHDDSGEIEFIKENFSNATQEEIEFYLEEFKKYALTQLGH